MCSFHSGWVKSGGIQLSHIISELWENFSKLIPRILCCIKFYYQFIKLRLCSWAVWPMLLLIMVQLQNSVNYYFLRNNLVIFEIIHQCQRSGTLQTDHSVANSACNLLDHYIIWLSDFFIFYLLQKFLLIYLKGS